MKLKEINSLVELFFKKLEQKSFEESKELFLISLKNRDFADTLSGPYTYSWSNVEKKINILSNYLKNIILKGERCILLSENRPEWLIADLSIMNAGGVTVPLFTTYAEKDYEYIVNDCKPKIFIVSNDIQLKKIEKFISNETKILSIEKINEMIESLENIFNAFNSLVKMFK